MAVSIQLNGEKRQLQDPCSLSQLVQELGLNPQTAIAVALNQEIIPRGKHSEVFIKDRDQVEIIHPVGGG
jgi:sulfur carrier protein